MGSQEEVKRGGVASMGEAVSTYLRWSGLDRKVGDLQVLTTWKEAVGEELAARARAVRFKMGVLTVEVESAPHFHELASFKGDQLKRIINRKLGSSRVRRIDFRLKQ